LKSDLYGGIAILRRARDPAAQKKLAEAGYGGEPIVVIAPTELAGIRALSLIGAEKLRRADLNVDLQEMEFGAVVKRRTSSRRRTRAAGTFSSR
jgi:peptide/nickel transport system substrate-binding protein